MTMIRKLFLVWMLALVGSLLLPLVSLAVVLGTTYDIQPTTTTASATITEHTTVIETLGCAETDLQSMVKNQACSLLGLSPRFVAPKSTKLYHYTGANPNKIAAEGLIPGGSGKVFTTPSGKLSPLQAQLDLALPPNRGVPNHLLEIDIPTLQGMGMKVPQGGPVGRMFNMPGGGTEIVFPHAIPAEAIKVVR